MKSQWLEESAPETWLDAWHRYVTTPPETAADALEGLERAADLAEDCGLAPVRGILASACADLAAGAEKPDLAARLRRLAQAAWVLDDSADRDCARLLQSIANGLARPRVVTL